MVDKKWQADCRTFRKIQPKLYVEDDMCWPIEATRQSLRVTPRVGLLVLVAHLCPTLCHPIDCSLPGSSVQGIFQARILEWVAISFSTGPAWLWNWTWVSYTAGRFFTIWATREAPWSAKAAITKHRRRKGSIVLEPGKTKVKGALEQVSLKSSLSGLKMAAFSQCLTKQNLFL